MMPFSPELDPDAEREQGETHVVLAVWLCTIGFVATVAAMFFYERHAYFDRHGHLAPSLSALGLWIVGFGR